MHSNYFRDSGRKRIRGLANFHHQHIKIADGTFKKRLKEYPPALIQPAVLKEFTHLKKSTTNEVIQRVNEAI